MLQTAVFAAPIVTVPGEAAGFLYFPPPIIGTSAAKKTETIGRISIFTSATIPEGWLECNGVVVQAADYPELVEYLTGSDTATSVALPDLRGEFLMGLDAGAGIDPGRIVGTTQGSSNRSHSHSGSTSSNGDHSHAGSSTSTDGDHIHSVSGFAFAGSGAGSGFLSSPLRTTGSWGTFTGLGTSMNWAPDHTHGLDIQAGGDHTHTVTIASSGGVEARPRNVSVIFAIRAE